jgi:hypothetical protein
MQFHIWTYNFLIIGYNFLRKKWFVGMKVSNSWENLISTISFLAITVLSWNLYCLQKVTLGFVTDPIEAKYEKKVFANLKTIVWSK